MHAAAMLARGTAAVLADAGADMVSVPLRIDSVCMYVCVCVCVQICTYIHICLYVYMCACVYVYVCVCVCVRVCVCVCVYIWSDTHAGR